MTLVSLGACESVETLSPLLFLSVSVRSFCFTLVVPVSVASSLSVVPVSVSVASSLSAFFLSIRATISSYATLFVAPFSLIAINSFVTSTSVPKADSSNSLNALSVSSCVLVSFFFFLSSLTTTGSATAFKSSLTTTGSATAFKSFSVTPATSAASWTFFALAAAAAVSLLDCSVRCSSVSSTSVGVSARKSGKSVIPVPLRTLLLPPIASATAWSIAPAPPPIKASSNTPVSTRTCSGLYPCSVRFCKIAAAPSCAPSSNPVPATFLIREFMFVTALGPSRSSTLFTPASTLGMSNALLAPLLTPLASLPRGAISVRPIAVPLSAARLRSDSVAP